jgi:polysaccharide deacetylase family protein (PEP-CTERM system associated)
LRCLIQPVRFPLAGGRAGAQSVVLLESKIGSVSDMDERRTIASALSFDLEEWFQAEVFSRTFPPSCWEDLESRVEAQTDVILDLLEAHRLKATFFVLGWVAERHSRLVTRIAGGGHEIACHGYAHTMITKQSRKGFEEDIDRARGILEGITGERVSGYRAPTFSITEETRWALDVLCGNGFLYDSSIYPIHHDRYGIPGSPRYPYVVMERGGRTLWEFPGPTMRIAAMVLPAAGGGYLRLFPRWWTRAAVKAAHRVDRPANVYAHPWEFDRGLPEVKLPLVSRFRHYRGISGNLKKLRRLMEEFQFIPMGEVIKELQDQRNRRHADM